jgi:hypothetical protein
VPASAQALHELSACGSHFADVVQDLACLARVSGLGQAQITLEAIDTGPASTAGRRGGRILSSVPLTTIEVTPASAA